MAACLSLHSAHQVLGWVEQQVAGGMAKAAAGDQTAAARLPAVLSVSFHDHEAAGSTRGQSAEQLSDAVQTRKRSADAQQHRCQAGPADACKQDMCLTGCTI